MDQFLICSILVGVITYGLIWHDRKNKKKKTKFPHHIPILVSLSIWLFSFISFDEKPINDIVDSVKQKISVDQQEILTDLPNF